MNNLINRTVGKGPGRRIMLVAVLLMFLAASIAASAAVFPDSAKDDNLPTYIAARMPAASQEQAAALEDHALDRSEYARAFDAYGECAAEAGARIVKPRTWSDEISDFELWVEIPTAASSTVEPAVDTCWDQHVGILQDYWHWQIDGRPTEADLATQQAAVHTRIVACLQANGLEVGSGSPAELNQAMASNRPVFKECVLAAQSSESP
ncbi:MAG: hypothetical protein GWP04_12310 [Gammaproteobacteria bacterium]|nr:hypothetical protein [Gammaproteobacteria bacterium]